ncbi:MAG: phytanoyl-CoA dioxygenase family protein [Gammaproteobacteria bacterium]|nr:phytanoyl-CoA dioxygenase family protein [Gammaproteobacteria bacterium]
MDDYLQAGERRAYALGNRGPLRFLDDGTPHPDALAAYWKHGFYVFENALGDAELEDLTTELAGLLARAPVGPDSDRDRHGRRAFGDAFTTPVFVFGKPLSDPYGGTDANFGRHPAKMSEPVPAPDAPAHTLYFVNGILQVMDSCLRLYGHPKLLRLTEAINGADFAPFGDSIWIKEPGLGTSVAWHQDGTTHWDHPRWDEGIHGFNFMAQLYPTTPENALWVVPGSHKRGKIDIKTEVQANGGDRLPDAVPMLCCPGDVAICNRQALHGSFANTSPARRVSIVFGFHRLDAVRNVEKRRQNGDTVVYDDARIRQRSRVIQVAIDARAQRFPDETPYRYQPFVGDEDDNRWNEHTRRTVLRDYNLLNLGI